jgi:hypothetical protein
VQLYTVQTPSTGELVRTSIVADRHRACAEHFRKIAPGFRTVPGLIRKQFKADAKPKTSGDRRKREFERLDRGL